MDKTKQSYQQDLIFIAKAKKDATEFSLLYNKYWEQIFYFIFKKIQNTEDTGDVCQTAMLKAMMNLPKYEDRGFPFSAWLYRIASNEVNLHFRKQKKNGFVELKETDVIDLMDTIEIVNTSSIDQQEQLILILEALKPNESELIEMRYFFKYSFNEIANHFKISEANAKMKVYRIIDKLKTKWSTTND